MKAIIIATSLSGKTTIIKQLRKTVDFPISEIDEELTDINGGKYPLDNDYKNKVLAPKIIRGLLNKNNILFFTNTDYFSQSDLQEAKNKGFKIIQINVDYEELLKRNSKRVKDEGYSDLSNWLMGMLEYQRKIKGKRLVDGIVDGNQPVLHIIKQLKSLLIFR